MGLNIHIIFALPFFIIGGFSILSTLCMVIAIIIAPEIIYVEGNFRTLVWGLIIGLPSIALGLWILS